MSKTIVVNGCSFTNWNYTWASRIRDILCADNQVDSPITFINKGHKGNSNDVIIPQTLDFVKQLNTNDDIIVIMQLTALDRIVVDGQMSPIIGSFLKSLNWMKWGMSQAETMHTTWEDYFTNEYSEENHINSLLNNLINFQNDLKEYENIQYKIFCGWDIFTQDTGKSSMWDLKIKYENKKDPLVMSLYESSQDLFEKLDLDKFWFFENKYIHYGGLSQWVQYNIDTEYWYRNAKKLDFHPSRDAHIIFANEVILPIISQMLERKR